MNWETHKLTVAIGGNGSSPVRQGKNPQFWHRRLLQTQSGITVQSIQWRKADVLEVMIHKPSVKNIESKANETGSRLLSGYSRRSRLAVSMPVKQEDAKSHPAIRDRQLCVNRVNDALGCHRSDRTHKEFNYDHDLPSNLSIEESSGSLGVNRRLV